MQWWRPVGNNLGCHVSLHAIVSLSLCSLWTRCTRNPTCAWEKYIYIWINVEGNIFNCSCTLDYGYFGIPEVLFLWLSSFFSKVLFVLFRYVCFFVCFSERLRRPSPLAPSCFNSTAAAFPPLRGCMCPAAALASERCHRVEIQIVEWRLPLLFKIKKKKEKKGLVPLALIFCRFDLIFLSLSFALAA